MPFSMIAVLILVLSSTSIALVYGMDLKQERTAIPQDTLEDMIRTMDDSCEDVLRLAYAAASEAVMDERSLNQSELQDRFLSHLGASLSDERPAEDEDIWTTVDHHLSLRFLQASLRESYALHGEGMTTREAGSVPAYFVILGNFSVNVSCSDGMLTRTVEVEQDVYVPLPLLTYRLDRLSSTLAPRGEVENMVRYELAALAQFRVLHGYGSTAETGQFSTEAVLTTEDVIKAVELAVVLQELRFFQDASQMSVGPFGNDIDLLGLEGNVDPADLFLRLCTEGGIDVAGLVAQSLYARADAIVLKWMDYLGLLTIPNEMEELYETVEGGLWAVIDSLTGGDRDRSNMASYISQAMSDAGIVEANYRWHNYGGGDIVVTLPQYKVCLTDDDGDLVCRYFQGTYALDLPSIDLLASDAWGEIYERYRSETHLIADGLKAYLEALANGISSHCSLPILEMELDPVDGSNYLDEMDRQLRQAFRDRSSWLTPALNWMEEVGEVRDGLAQAVIDFIQQRWMELFQVNRSVYQAAQELSGILASELVGEQGFSSSSIAAAQETLFMLLMGDSWGARDVIHEAVRERASPIVDRLQWGMSQRYSEIDPLVGLLASGVSTIPGVGALTSISVLDTLDGIESGQTARGGKFVVPLSSGGIVLTLADGQQRTESFLVADSIIRSSSDGRVGSLDVNIVLPWEFDRSNSTYPQRHVTDVISMSSSPYLTQWSIGYEGEVETVIRSGMEGAGTAVSCSSTVHLSSDFKVVAFSGWGLKGVAYEPTATLVGDLQVLLLKAWDLLVSSVRTLGGTMGLAFMSFHQLLEDLLTYSTESVEVLNELLSTVVDQMKGMIDGLLDSVIEMAADHIVGVMEGTVIDLSVLGLDLDVSFGPKDVALAGVTDLIRVDIQQSLFGATIASSLRVLRLPTGEHTITGSAVLGDGDWKVGITFDPFNKIYSHQVEVRGYLGDQNLELYLPEVERSKKVSLSLSDIPGLAQLLSSIPGPVPGTKFHIDAGMELRFNLPDRYGVVINEVELNPQGQDHSREWVEIFNPTDEIVDLTGWTLVSSHGRTHQEFLSGSLVAHGRLVHQLSGQFLDNGEVEGFPLQESAVLLDDEGNRIDAAPWLRDLHDDDRTWQRSFDGSSSWELRTHTKGTSNGQVWTEEHDLGDITATMVDCFQRSFAQYVGTGADITVLKDILASALSELGDRLLDSMEEAISSLRFTLELGLDDGTGSIGGGIFASLVYDGKAVRACLEWLIEAIGEVLRDPLNPMAAAARAPVPIETLATHVFAEMGIYVQVGTPDMLISITDAKVSARAVIGCNLGSLTPLEEGTGGEMRFGLVINGVMGGGIRSPFELVVKETYDVWVIRGVLRQD